METLFILVLGILIMTLWVWAVIDIVKSEFKDTTQKVAWLVLVVLFPILGSIVYFQIGRKYTARRSIQFQPKFKSAG